MLNFSVIIPTLNEEQRIERCLAAVRESGRDVEIIVADGGSTDSTVELARQSGAFVCTVPRGRGVQCNAGAAVARGTVLLFLHADTLLPPDAFALLAEQFQDERVQLGTFRIRFDERNWFLDFCARFSRFDSVLTSFGDQCIVVRRTFFDTLGGFPDWPLFEDVRLLQQARGRTRIYKFPAAVTSSARRFRQGGFVRQLLRNGWLLGQYLWGVSPQRLAAHYERTRPEVQ